MSPFREVAHTADVALEVWADSLARLFEDAARGMLALAAQTPTDGGAAQALPLSLDGDDYEGLLVSWLQELLYYAEADGWAFHDFQVEALTPARLQATAQGRPGQQPEKIIKAVTYHNLAIREADGGFRVTLVFDV